jgi:hypothetical protein
MAKKNKPTPAPTVFLHLDADGYTEVTREADPDDQWSASDTATTWHVNGISLSDRDGHQAMPADFPVEVGDTVHAVYAVYSTGDTFHRADGEYLEIISFHKDANVASKNLAGLNARRDHGSAGNDYKMTITYDSGATVERHCPWDGYFESLDYVSMSTFTVTDGGSKRY